MAMIVCPHCGEQVSEKAKKCVHCGEILILEEKKHCTECGVELEEGMTECPNCGCPVDDTIGQETDEKPQKVEVTGVKVTKKKKAAEEYAQRVEEYSDNLNLATVTMLTGASDAESSANLIKQVWYNAIYEKRDDETDKYTRPKGYFVSDFNDALGNLYADSSFSSKVSSIEDNQDTVNALMKKLKNPPDEYKDAYDAVSDLYDAYISFTNCATDPSGSLQTYSSTVNDADTNTLNAYKALELYLDD